MSIIKFEDNVSIIVTLDYDEAKRVDGTYGTQYLYGVNNGADTFYATATLSALIGASGCKKGDEVTILKVPKVDERSGKSISIFTVNGKSSDDFNRGIVKNPLDSPIGVGFAQKDVKYKKADDEANITMSDLDYRVSLLEGAVTELEENQHHHPSVDDDDDEKDGRKAEAELPF
jgi:hypothetical protein